MRKVAMETSGEARRVPKTAWKIFPGVLLLFMAPSPMRKILLVPLSGVKSLRRWPLLARLVGNADRTSNEDGWPARRPYSAAATTAAAMAPAEVPPMFLKR